jgi:hypothetical protein
MVATVYNIRPGTMAEARFIEQIQSELLKALTEESPAVAQHMSLSSSAPASRPSGDGKQTERK